MDNTNFAILHGKSYYSLKANEIILAKCEFLSIINSSPLSDNNI